MRLTRSISVALLLSLAIAGCRREADEASRDVDTASASETAAVTSAAAAPDKAQVTGPQGQVVDGPLASQPNATLPTAGAGRGTAPTLGPQSADVDSVRLALLDGMGEAGGNLRVQVTPAGVVSLSGEVQTVADRQRAHYLARALPGVAEVDLRGVRVRQP